MKNLQRSAAVLILLALPWATGCFTLAGGAIGGTLGGGVGLVGGVCTGHPVEGITIGATGGAVVGAATGAVVDTVITAPLRIPGAIADAVRSPPGMSVDDVIDMHESGVATDMIILQIQAEGMKKRPTSQDLVRLAQKNVAQDIVIAMRSNIVGEMDQSITGDIPTPPSGPQQIHEQAEATQAQPFLIPELPSNEPDMTPAVSGGAFGPPNEGVPGFTPRPLSGLSPSGSEGGQWSPDDVPRTPGGARIQPHPQAANTFQPSIPPPPRDLPVPTPIDNPTHETTDASSGTVDYDSIWRR
jgi:hypothetical protein